MKVDKPFKLCALLHLNTRVYRLRKLNRYVNLMQESFASYQTVYVCATEQSDHRRHVNRSVNETVDIACFISPWIWATSVYVWNINYVRHKHIREPSRKKLTSPIFNSPGSEEGGTKQIFIFEPLEPQYINMYNKSSGKEL